MDIEIDIRGSSTEARLLDPEDFASFRVVVIAEAASLQDVLEPVGVARVDEHAWIRIDALRQLAGPAATSEWETSLEAMLEFAGSRGWVDEELEAIRGHVVRRSAR